MTMTDTDRSRDYSRDLSVDDENVSFKWCVVIDNATSTNQQPCCTSRRLPVHTHTHAHTPMGPSRPVVKTETGFH